MSWLFTSAGHSIGASGSTCNMDSQWGAAVWHGELPLGLCDDPEGGTGGGRSGGGTCIHVADSFTVQKKPTNIVKQLYPNKE